MAKISLVLLLAALGSFSAGLKLPTYLKACKEDDPNLNKCAVESLKAAIPSLLNGDRKYSIPPLNPLVIEKAEIPGNGLDLTFKNIKLYGIKDIIIKDVKFDTKKQVLGVTFMIPHLYVDTDYKVDGKILVVPIKGEGKANITAMDVDITYSTSYEKQKDSKGDVYLKPNNDNFEYKMSRAYFQLENLFNGDKALSDATHRFLDENWEDVVKEMGPPVFEVVRQISSTILGSIASKVPYKDFWAN